MFWKLVVMVLTIGGTGCGLLVLRQQEIDLLATETDLHRRAEKLEQSLQMTRWELEQLTQDARFERWFKEQGIDREPVDLKHIQDESHASARKFADETDGESINIARSTNQGREW